jgi:hypothetical protein
MTGGARDSKRLMLFDLDNTLIDRAAAFRSWASRFVRERELEPDVVDWLDSIDDDGIKPRETFFGGSGTVTGSPTLSTRSSLPTAQRSQR